MKPLILIVTRRCNLRCRYCDVEKYGISMSEEVAQKATSLYFAWVKENKQKNILIRFFGGEPLMNFTVIKCVVAYAKRCAKKEKMNVTFDLTTNGILIDDAVIDFFKKNPEMRVIISLDGDEKTQNLNRKINTFKTNSYKNILAYKNQLLSLPNVMINMVITQNQVRYFHKNFLHNYDLGFRRFNFLPAYFTAWGKSDLRKLATELDKLVQFLRIHSDVFIKNKEIMSDIPFFNSGFVVDCNGDFFGTNLFLSSYYAHLRDDVLEGNVRGNEKFESLSLKSGTDMISLMRDEGDLKLFYASMKVDAVLRNFVRKLNI